MFLFLLEIFFHFSTLTYRSLVPVHFKNSLSLVPVPLKNSLSLVPVPLKNSLSFVPVPLGDFLSLLNELVKDLEGEVQPLPRYAARGLHLYTGRRVKPGNRITF